MVDLASGVCPWCESRGPIGQPCDQRPCQKRGYAFVPYEHAPEGHGELDPEIGRVVGGHLLVSVLGGGGFGKVYLALQLPLLMRTALKLVLPEAMDGVADALQRFEAEARALARLSHPNVVRLVQYGAHAGRPFMVMELVEGGVTLKAELARRAARGEELQGATILDVLEQVLNGLEAAHALGIIHRDIKPENLMLQRVPGHERLVKILDFGLVKELADGTKTSAALGTPVYMAPEQILRRNLGPWTDLYAVGAVAFELMTGRRAFGGPTPQAVIGTKLDPTTDPLARVGDLAIPPLTAAFLRRALAFEPEARFREVPEMRAALRGAAAEIFAGERSVDVSQLVSPSELEAARRVTPSTAVTLPPEPGLSRLGVDPRTRRGRRAPWAMLALGLVVVAGAGVTFVATRDVGTPPGVQEDVAAPEEVASAPEEVAAAPTAAPDTLGAPEPDVPTREVEAEAEAEPEDAPIIMMVDVGPGGRLAALNPWREFPAAPAGTRLGMAPAVRPPTRDATSFALAAGVPGPARAFALLDHAVTGDELAIVAPQSEHARAGAEAATRVPYALAERFCAAIGARLPDEAEWEWASVQAGGPSGRVLEWTSSLWREPETGVTPPWVDAGGQTYHALRGATPLEGVYARQRFCATGPCVERTAEQRPQVGFRCAADR